MLQGDALVWQQAAQVAAQLLQRAPSMLPAQLLPTLAAACSHRVLLSQLHLLDVTGHAQAFIMSALPAVDPSMYATACQIFRLLTWAPGAASLRCNIVTRCAGGRRRRW